MFQEVASRAEHFYAILVEIFWAVCSAHSNRPICLPPTQSDRGQPLYVRCQSFSKLRVHTNDLGILHTWRFDRSEVVQESTSLTQCCNDTNVADVGTTL